MLFPLVILVYCHEFLNQHVRSITLFIPLCYPLHKKYSMAQSVLHLPYVQRNVIKIIVFVSLCVAK
jgi:hypothetical protein